LTVGCVPTIEEVRSGKAFASGASTMSVSAYADCLIENIRRGKDRVTASNPPEWRVRGERVKLFARTTPIFGPSTVLYLVQIAPSNSGSQAIATIAEGIPFSQGVERDISDAIRACSGS
jgi:hypothetical protein